MSRQFQGKQQVEIPVDEILRKYAAWADELVDAIGNELLKDVRKYANTFFDDETGLLRSSIEKRKGQYGENTTIVGAFAPHAHLVEYGTDVRKSPETGKVSGQMPATLFMNRAKDAVDARRDQIIEKIVPPSVRVGQ